MFYYPLTTPLLPPLLPPSIPPYSPRATPLLQEGIEINVSLSALGNVISALAEKANNPTKKVFIPYRSHCLTELLQSALGGNSKTIMVTSPNPNPNSNPNPNPNPYTTPYSNSSPIPQA